jgi:pRiA4b ORF-3-like protein
MSFVVAVEQQQLLLRRGHAPDDARATTAEPEQPRCADSQPDDGGSAQGAVRSSDGRDEHHSSENYHMHCFSSRGAAFGMPDPELGFMDERKVGLDELIGGIGDRLRYTYDFGDDWEHEILV